VLVVPHVATTTEEIMVMEEPMQVPVICPRCQKRETTWKATVQDGEVVHVDPCGRCGYSPISDDDDEPT
jgi:hypothetical protein